MLKDSLYKIISLNQPVNVIDAELELNIDDPIFSGHFPGRSVLPGACMLQMVKEVLEEVFEKPIRLKVADQMKFLKMIDPVVNKMLILRMTYMIDGESILITATMSAVEEVVFKLKGTFLFIKSNNH
jgi:3-hydroxyacyl-[acyl-carrier-protein] dehydratase